MSEADEIAAWLRKQAEADLAAAKIISAGGFEPQWWDTDPPGQVNPQACPDSAAVTTAIGQEPESSCGWVPVWVRDQVIGGPPDDYTSGVAVLAELGRREFDHVIRHDPRTEAARAQSVLEVLNDRAQTSAIANPPECPQGEIAGRDYLDAKRELAALDHVVRLLAAGYRHREGWKEAWRP